LGREEAGKGKAPELHGLVPTEPKFDGFYGHLFGWDPQHGLRAGGTVDPEAKVKEMS